MYRKARQMTPERHEALWAAFIEAYTSTETRPAVDMFLRGLLCAPEERAA